ncbi:MAG TPA: 6-phosphogluconolactonase [Polyangiaceae bacterium]
MSETEGVELRVLPTAELPARAADWLAQVLAEVAAEKGRVTLALAGGSTPRAMHEALACSTAVPWLAVHVFFGDERAVPPDHPESNYRMAKESLLDRVPIPPHQVHRMEGENPDREAAARAYEALLPDALDVLVLGMGEDGHTASLFPGAESLHEATRRVLPVIGPKPPPARLTLTPPAILGAARRVVLVAGAGKADAVARALEGPWDPNATPVQLARRGVWFVDPSAAAKLEHR